MNRPSGLLEDKPVGSKNIHGDIVLNREGIWELVSLYKTDPVIETAANSIKDRLVTQDIRLIRGGNAIELTSRLRDIFKQKWKPFILNAIDSINVCGLVIVCLEKDEHGCVYPVVVPPENGDIIVKMKDDSFQYEYDFMPSNMMNNSYLPHAKGKYPMTGGGPEKITRSKRRKKEKFLIFSGFGYDPRIIENGAILTSPCAKVHSKKTNLVIQEYFSLAAQSKQSAPDIFLEYKDKDEGSVEIEDSIYQNEEDRILKKEQLKGMKEVESVKRSKVVKYLIGPARYINPESFKRKLEEKTKPEKRFVPLPVDRKISTGPRVEAKTDIIKIEEQYESYVYKAFGTLERITGAGVRLPQVQMSEESFNFRLKSMSDGIESMITKIFKRIYEEDESEYIALMWLEKSEIAQRYVEEKLMQKMQKEVEQLEKMKKSSKTEEFSKEKFKLEKKINKKKRKILNVLRAQFIQIAASKTPIQNIFAQTSIKEKKTEKKRNNNKRETSDDKRETENKEKRNGKVKEKEEEENNEKNGGKKRSDKKEEGGKSKKRKRNETEKGSDEKEGKAEKKVKKGDEGKEKERDKIPGNQLNDIMRLETPPKDWWDFIDSRELFQKMIRDQEALEKVYQSVKPELKLNTMYLNTPEQLKQLFVMKVIDWTTFVNLMLAKANISEHSPTEKSNPFSEEEMGEMALKAFTSTQRKK